jgi:hypothetical protein
VRDAVAAAERAWVEELEWWGDREAHRWTLSLDRQYSKESGPTPSGYVTCRVTIHQ